MAAIEKSDALFAIDDWPGAERKIRGALKLDPANPAAQSRLCSILYTQGDIAGAEREIRKAIELNPEEADFHYILLMALRGPIERP